MYIHPTPDTPLLPSTPPAYPPPILENLLFRYEEPNGMTRWDSPLFTVPYLDPAPPLNQIWTTIILGRGIAPVKPNRATVEKPASGEDFLQDLDRATQEVVTLVLEHQRDAGVGGHVRIEGSPNASASLVVVRLPPRDIGVPQLQRIRRQFIALNRMAPQRKERIRELFVGYLNEEL